MLYGQQQNPKNKINIALWSHSVYYIEQTVTSTFEIQKNFKNHEYFSFSLKWPHAMMLGAGFKACKWIETREAATSATHKEWELS